MNLEQRFDELRKQSKEDFQFTMLALDNVTSALTAVGKEIGQVRARMARQEERFEAMLDAVQGADGEALEAKSPPAA